MHRSLMSSVCIKQFIADCRGGSRGGGGRTRRAPPLKLEKNLIFFVVKSWFFTRNTPSIFAPPSARRNFFMCAPPPPNLKSWIRPWTATTPSPSTKLFNNYCGSILDVLLSTGHFRYFEKFFVCVNSYLPWNYFNVPYSVGRCAIFTK